MLAVRYAIHGSDFWVAQAVTTSATKAIQEQDYTPD
jgi:hypothetical protein